MAKCSVCKEAAACGDPNVGPATVFISWGLISTLTSLEEALERRVADGLLKPTDYLWVCDTCIRQHEGEGKERDVARLDDMVRHAVRVHPALQRRVGSDSETVSKCLLVSVTWLC